MANFSLRAKSLLALALAFLLVLIPATLAGWAALQGLRQHFSLVHAQNVTELNRERLLAPVLQDLALSLRLANSEVARRWLANEDDPNWRELFFLEAESDRQVLRDNAYFIISASSGHYYFNSNDKPISTAPRYTLKPDNPDDAWFYRSLQHPDAYNLNINTDTQLRLTRVWINVPVRATTSPTSPVLGLAGASIDLSRFLQNLTASVEPGVTPMLIDGAGAIQAHPDPDRIAYNTAARDVRSDSTLMAQVAPADQATLQTALDQARRQVGDVVTLSLPLAGAPQEIALSYLPQLDWFVLTAVDPKAAKVLHPAWLWAGAAGFVVLLAALFLGFGLGVERLVLRPIRRLQQSAHAIAAGQYNVKLPPISNDEIGDLSRSFGEMASQVQHHTSELEARVRDRTRELEAANAAMAQAQKKIGDSIDYASLIQRATLPSRQLTQSLGPNHFVMWRPRDVVGGDFYIFHADGANCLLGIIDCAGHGVPGALMTMLARAAVDLAIQECGATDPAALLHRIDSAMRTMLADSQLPRGLATNADAGLVYINRQTRQICYAGAKISLYAAHAGTIQEWRGGKRSLGDRRPGEYTNQTLPLDAGATYYLTTDGLLDQAGGEHGYGFGNQRFRELLQHVAELPLASQAAAISAAIEQYQGGRPQRDDITLLSFRFDSIPDPAS